MTRHGIHSLQSPCILNFHRIPKIFHHQFPFPSMYKAVFHSLIIIKKMFLLVSKSKITSIIKNFMKEKF